MSSMKTSVVLLLMWLMMLTQAAPEDDRKAHERRDEVVASFTKKSHSLLEVPYIGRQEQVLNKIPLDFIVLFKTTVYVEAALLCVVLPYGVFHLPCWTTLFQRCNRSKAKRRRSEFSDEQFEMVEVEHDEEASDSDVIVNCSDEEV